MDRRQFLKIGSLAGVAGLAGCFGDADDESVDTSERGETDESGAQTAYHVATDGNDNNLGTPSEPIATVQEALHLAEAGDTIEVGSGEYLEVAQDGGTIETVHAGEPNAPITLTGPDDAVLRPGIQLKHSHFHLRGLSIEGVTDPERKEDPDVYHGGGAPIGIQPPDESDEYVENIVCAPHGVGFGRHRLIGLTRAKNIEIGPLKVTGLAGGDWIITQEPDRHAGEIVYVGSPPGAVFDWYGPVVEDYPWADEIDETSHVHIHHIDNSEAHPHSQLVDAKLGTRDVLVEYCTDGGGSQNTEPWPVSSISLGGQDATVRWCDLREGQGDGILVSGGGPRVLDELDDPPIVPEKKGTGNSIYENFIHDFGNQSVRFRGANAKPDTQEIICGNEMFAPHIQGGSTPCPTDLPSGDGIGHSQRSMPDGQIPTATALTLVFNRAPLASDIHSGTEDDRHLAFMCYELVFLDEEDRPIFSVDVGPDDSAAVYGKGVYESVAHNGESSRFFGGPERTTRLFFVSRDIEGATYLQLTGWPVDDDISADVYFDGEHVDQVEFIEGMNTYELSLVS